MSTKNMLAVTILSLALASVANAQDIDKVTLNYVGSWSSLNLYKHYEKPFWSQKLPKASNGRISVKVTSFDQMGLKGGEVFRLLSKGVYDIGSTVADYTVQDAPELGGLDMPMIAPKVKQAHKVAEAYKPVLDKALKKRFNAKLIAVVPYPKQVLFCNDKITGLKSLKGKKVRASGRTTAEFLQGIGANGITMSYSEVPGALQRGVIDCAVTGSLSGYSSGWYQVAKYLYPMPIGGWDYVVTAMNGKKWASLNPATQQFILKQVKKNYETPVWQHSNQASQQGVACLTGKGTCDHGKPGHMTLVKPTKADLKLAKQTLENKVLPAWAKRVSTTWVKRWNDTIGQVTGVHAGGGS